MEGIINLVIAVIAFTLFFVALSNRASDVGIYFLPLLSIAHLELWLIKRKKNDTTTEN